jgi:Uma2 family endonuclease
MTPAPLQRLTEAEYLALERDGEQRHEYFAGELFAMGGGSEAHNLITLNVAGALRTALRGRPCRVYASDMRLKVALTGHYTYADVMAVFGERQFEDGRRDTLLNAVLVVEVLSPRTEAYDRGEKFAHYRRLPSLKEYVLVSQHQPRVERYTHQREGEDWLLTEVSDPEGRIALASLGCEIAMADIYEQIEFPEGPAVRSADADAQRV